MEFEFKKKRSTRLEWTCVHVNIVGMVVLAFWAWNRFAGNFSLCISFGCVWISYHSLSWFFLCARVFVHVVALLTECAWLNDWPSDLQHTRGRVYGHADAQVQVHTFGFELGLKFNLSLSCLLHCISRISHIIKKTSGCFTCETISISNMQNLCNQNHSC